MPGIIRIRIRHNHPLDSPSALAFLSPPKSLEEEFYGYFKMGMDISTASHYHESKLLFEDDDFDSEKYDLNNNSAQESSPEIDTKNIIDNPRLNPRKRSVTYWYTKWREENFGSRDDADLQKVPQNTINFVKWKILSFIMFYLFDLIRNWMKKLLSTHLKAQLFDIQIL